MRERALAPGPLEAKRKHPPPDRDGADLLGGAVDEYVEASGAEAPDLEDLALLARYLARNADTSCLIGCGDCLSSCPAGVSISDIMRR